MLLCIKTTKQNSNRASKDVLANNFKRGNKTLGTSVIMSLHCKDSCNTCGLDRSCFILGFTGQFCEEDIDECLDRKLNHLFSLL